MAAVAYDFPTPAELSEIEQVTLPTLKEERNSPFLEAFPDEPHEDTVIMWEQLDNFTGLMQFRGYNNKPARVNRVGAQRFMTQPGVYGEFMPIEEDQLTRRRMLGRFGERVSVADLVAQAQRQLLVRRLQLKEYIVSQFVINGTYSVPDGSGVNWTGDGFTPQTYSPATYAWSDHANATPLYDLMQIALVPFGQSVNVVDSEFVINQLTFNNLVLNRNANDFPGLRNNFGATIPNSLTKINEMFVAYGLPKIRVYDRFYKADNGTRLGSTVRYVPNGTGILFARRDSTAKAGGFAYTWNDQCQAAKPYTFVKYRDEEVPRVLEVHDGFNGGPLIRYPGTIVVATGL